MTLAMYSRSTTVSECIQSLGCDDMALRSVVSSENSKKRENTQTQLRTKHLTRTTKNHNGNQKQGTLLGVVAHSLSTGEAEAYRFLSSASLVYRVTDTLSPSIKHIHSNKTKQNKKETSVSAKVACKEEMKTKFGGCSPAPR